MPETTSTQTGFERVRNRADTRARTRWLEVSRVRFHGRPGSPSHKTQEPARWRCDAQLDYALRRLSRQMSRRPPVETTGFIFFGNTTGIGRRYENASRDHRRSRDGERKPRMDRCG